MVESDSGSEKAEDELWLGKRKTMKYAEPKIPKNLKLSVTENYLTV
jgi:hypothetical protein